MVFINLLFPIRFFCFSNLYFNKILFKIKLRLLKNKWNYNFIKILSILNVLKIKKSHITITKKVKTKSSVNKSNRKIYKQKGLGKARIRSLKSSSAKGGGVIFGPKSGKKNVILNNELNLINIKYSIVNNRHSFYLKLTPYFNCVFVEHKLFVSKLNRINGFFYKKNIQCLI